MQIKHTETYVQQFPDGITVHVRIEIARGIENNADKWFIAYWINGRGYQFERFAGYGARHHHLYVRGIDNAILSAKMRVDNRIEKIRPLEVWVCPKPTPVPSAIVPYGTLFTPVTYAPVQPVISEPSPDARKALAGETMRLKHVTYARRGNLDRWLAVCVFDGQEVHFPMYPEHAKHIQKHTDRILKTQGMTHFHVELYVVVDWNTHHNDLRLSGVQGDDGMLHPLVRELPTPQPVKAEDDTRTDFQKLIGSRGKYSKMDFRLNKPKAS